MTAASMEAVLFDFGGVITEPVTPMFEAIAAAASAPVAEVAALLDDFEVNLAGARAVGLHTVHVGDDTDAALAELERLLAAARTGTYEWPRASAFIWYTRLSQMNAKGGRGAVRG